MTTKIYEFIQGKFCQHYQIYTDGPRDNIGTVGMTFCIPKFGIKTSMSIQFCSLYDSRIDGHTVGIDLDKGCMPNYDS